MPRPKSGNAPWEAVAMKLPKDLLAELRRFSDLHRMTLSEVMREGLILRMKSDTAGNAYNSYPLAEDTAQDALLRGQIRDILQAELPGMVQALVEQYQGEPRVSKTRDSDGTETVAPAQPQTRAGRPRGEMRQRILTLLGEHPEGLSVEELRVFLRAEKPLGDTLQGMRRQGKVQTRGQGKATRYFAA
jgi:hypothetical protein